MRIEATERIRKAVALLVGGTWVLTGVLMVFEAFSPSADFYPNGLALGPPGVGTAASELAICTLWAAVVLIVAWPTFERRYTARLAVVGAMSVLLGLGPSDSTLVEFYRHEWMFFLGLALALIAFALGIGRATEALSRSERELSR